MSSWYFPFTDGFTGPYYSDGKFQSSVLNGTYVPKGRLAEFSRDHDTLYYLSNGSRAFQDQADRDYYRATRDEHWKGNGFIPKFIGMLPLMFHNPLGLIEEVVMGYKQEKGRETRTTATEVTPKEKSYDKVDVKTVDKNTLNYNLKQQTANKSVFYYGAVNKDYFAGVPFAFGKKKKNKKRSKTRK